MTLLNDDEVPLTTRKLNLRLCVLAAISAQSELKISRKSVFYTVIVRTTWVRWYVKTHKHDARLIKPCSLTSVVSSLPMPSSGGQCKISSVFSPLSESKTIRQNGEFITFLRVMYELSGTQYVPGINIIFRWSFIQRRATYYVSSMGCALIKMAAILIRVPLLLLGLQKTISVTKSLLLYLGEVILRSFCVVTKSRANMLRLKWLTVDDAMVLRCLLTAETS